MANGRPDFRFRSQFPIAGVAQMIAQKPVQEDAIKRARFNQFLNTITTSAQLARSIQGISGARRLNQGATSLADTLAGQVPGALPAGTEGPLQPGVLGQQEAIRSATMVDPKGAASKVLGIDRAGAMGRGQGPLSALTRVRDQLSEEILFETNDVRRRALEVRRDAVDKRITGLSGVKGFAPLPQEVEKAGEDIQGGGPTGGFFRNLLRGRGQQSAAPQFVVEALASQPIGTQIKTKDGLTFEKTAEGVARR